MNLLEQYIVEVHNEDPHKFEWTNEPYMKVDITTNCHGNISRKVDYFPKEVWDEIKSVGYYMA